MTARATSSLLPKRLSGTRSRSRWRAFSGIASTISVSMKPGATAFTVMPFEASSLARDFVMAVTRFRRVIAPGMLTASFVSAVIGTKLPGPGAVYLSQSLRFVKPVFVGDRVTARVEVTERLVERNRLRLRTTCANQDGDLLLEGEAWVLPATTRVEYEPPRASPPAGGPATSSRRPVEPFSQLAWAPAALPLDVASLWASLWVEGSLTLAGQAMRLWIRP